jgi:GDP-L-fucose synthase
MTSLEGVRVCVTGGTGMIGHYLTKELLELGANVRVLSLDSSNDFDHKNIEVIKVDLRSRENCEKAFKNQEKVFHLAGIKGSPKMTALQPASFFTNTLLFNLNVMDAAYKAGVSQFLFTSSVGVYAPAQLFEEDNVWKTFPSDNDKFAGYAKRMGELQAEAYEIEYGWEAVSIVRPANVYGSYDNFDERTGMVIPSLISRFAGQENPIKVWGDGTAIRDFVFARDVARAMIYVMEKSFRLPVNIGSGIPTSIREVVEEIATYFPGKSIEWDTSQPKGDDIRLMNVERLRDLGFNENTGLKDGLRETINWFLANKGANSGRYNAFDESRAETQRLK